MKTYLTINFAHIYKPDGWTEAEFDAFVDKLIEAAESFGPDVQMAATYQLLTEEEMEQE